MQGQMNLGLAQTYGSVAKFLHWLIFLLVVFMLVYGFFLEDIPKEYAGLAYNIHKLTGVLILLLMIVRAFWMYTHPKPSIAAGTLPWQRLIERVVHVSFYILLVAMPLSGWIGSSAAGKAPHLGSLMLSLPIPQDRAIVKPSFQLHQALAILIIAYLTIHVLAALYHQFIKRDDVLKRML